MRTVLHAQLRLGEEDIAKIKLDPRSRDDIPQILLGLQFIPSNSELRTSTFNII